MNVKALNFLKNLSYTISINLIALIVSILVILIIPKLIGIEEYGYWQLYFFYSSYIGFFHFGWNDGIYLRYGGEEYKRLDRRLFFSQFYTLIVSQIIIGIIIFACTLYLVVDFNREFIIGMIVIVMILSNSNTMLIFILQATNRIREYAFITLTDKIVFVSLLTLFLTIGIKDYKIMIYADILGKIVSLAFAMYLCRDIVFNKIYDYYFTINEIIINIKIGIKLMFANIASMLIVGIVRFGIERTWDVSTFGKVSLTLNISSLMMIFINAIGIILFPILRKVNPDKLPSIYLTMRVFLMTLLMGVLIIYYPLKNIMIAWLPQYADGLIYMALLFPMFLYEGKMALLINTYLKALRKENILLQINIISMFVSLIMTFISTVILSNLDLAIVTIIIVLALRSIFAELYLSNELKIELKKDIALELIVTILFVLLGWFIDSLLTLIIYAVVYVTYLIIKRKDILKSIQSIRFLMKA